MFDSFEIFESNVENTSLFVLFITKCYCLFEK